MSGEKNLVRRLVRRGLVAQIILAVMLFESAGSFRFWQGWVLMILHLTAGTFVGLYFLKRDPQLLERRMLIKEKLITQKIIIGLWRIVAALSVVLAGCDHRFGWSRIYLRPVPLWLEGLSFLLILGGHVLFFGVLQTNRFGASVIQVESCQTVITTGPYSLIRHPMYLAFALMGLFTPLALGSFVAVAASVLIMPIIALRLLNEEKMLRHDLAGYAEYCQRTSCRLIPFVW